VFGLGLQKIVFQLLAMKRCIGDHVDNSPHEENKNEMNGGFLLFVKIDEQHTVIVL
jgi:hypothetical protein